MPIYEYLCRDCDHLVEVVQSFQDAPLTDCPTCGGSLRKKFSAAGLVFKGSGWHVKDYASKPAGNGRSKGGEGSGSTSSESKPSDGTSTSTTSTSERPAAS